jgi:hypothetical protein
MIFDAPPEMNHAGGGKNGYSLIIEIHADK